jgi:phenylalanyl-tRNA synthetase alpha chain
MAMSDITTPRPDPGALDPESVSRALALRDLTDPAAGEHAVQHVVHALENALCAAWGLPVRRHRGPRIVPVADNYDSLRYPPEAATRDRRYTRYLGEGLMLRSHTSAHIPSLLRDIAAGGPDEVLLSVPGLCYRRDVIDRRHVGEPHQLDLWRIRRRGDPLTGDDLAQMVRLVVGTILPRRRWHTPRSEHPYTIAGREIYVHADATPVEIGECGLAHPQILTEAGMPATATGLAMGLGLDRLAMLAKNVPDIRLLRSTDPRIAVQMTDLSPYRPVSSMPAARRDISVAVAQDLDAELIGDRVRAVLGPDAAAVEEVIVLSETQYEDLPEPARARLGMRPGQKNLLLRVVLRPLDRTLSAADANRLRDRIYGGLHAGAVHQWTAGSG